MWNQKKANDKTCNIYIYTPKQLVLNNNPGSYKRYVSQCNKILSSDSFFND